MRLTAEQELEPHYFASSLDKCTTYRKRRPFQDASYTCFEQDNAFTESKQSDRGGCALSHISFIVDTTL